MALACDICQQIIPWRESHGERYQPHGTVNFKRRGQSSVRYVHCFNHSVEEVDEFILKDWRSNGA